MLVKDIIVGLYIIRSKIDTEHDMIRIESPVEVILLKATGDSAILLPKWLKLLRVAIRGDGNSCPFAQVENTLEKSQDHKIALAAAGKQLLGSGSINFDEITQDNSLASAGKKLFEVSNLSPEAAAPKEFLTRYARQTKRRWIEEFEKFDELSTLEEKELGELRSSLPWGLRDKKLNLLFRMSEHGASLSTLYEFVRKRGPSFLLIHTTKGQKLGAFASVAWTDSRNSYYGTGKCFVFHQVPPSVKIYCWTKKNNYFMVGGHDFIALGGGSAFGLYLNYDFSKCHSNSSPTFDNPSLVEGNSFACQDVEVYEFYSDNLS